MPMPVISPILQIKQLFAIVAKDTLVTIFRICQIIFRIYLGERCDKCDINFWGNPLEIGGSCEVCLMFILLYALFYMRGIFWKYNQFSGVWLQRKHRTVYSWQLWCKNRWLLKMPAQYWWWSMWALHRWIFWWCSEQKLSEVLLFCININEVVT